jgi:hypothetical protein
MEFYAGLFPYPLSIVNTDLFVDNGTFWPCSIPQFIHNMAQTSQSRSPAAIRCIDREFYAMESSPQGFFLHVRRDKTALRRDG